MAKENNRSAGKLLSNVIIDHLGIGHQLSPATRTRKMTQFLSVFAVPAMIVNAHSKSTFGPRCGEPRVAIAMFTEAVQNLDDAACLPCGCPKLRVNAVAIRGDQCLVLVM
jgi:hypothetical protein